MDALCGLFVTIIHDVFPLYAQEVKRQPLGSPTCLVLDYKVIYSFLLETDYTYSFLLLNQVLHKWNDIQWSFSKPQISE